MLPPASLPMPATWRNVLEELRPAFRRRSTHALFMTLACGMILAGRRTVVAMAAAAGMAERWRQACWFFSGAVWDIDDLGLAVARLAVKYLLTEGEPLVVACDGTFFKRWGRRVFQARWAYDGSAQGGKKVAFGNVWVVAALVVRLPFCSSPVALPVLFRLWRGKGTASQVELAAEMIKLLAGAFPGRQVHRDRGCRLPRRVPDRGREHLDDQAAVQCGAVRPEAAAHRQARPAEGQRGPAGYLRPDRGIGCLGRCGHQRLRPGHRGAGRGRRRAVVRQLQDRSRPRRAGPRPRLTQGVRPGTIHPRHRS